MKNIDDIAAAWVAREDAHTLSESEKADRDQWLHENVRHIGAYARAKVIFAHADRVRALGPGFKPKGAGVADVSIQRTSRRARSVRLWARSLAACAAAVVLVAVGAWLLDGRAVRYQTHLGEVATISLEDGSVVVLNSASELVVQFQRNARTLRLLKGEALFDVVKDRARPFQVRTDSARVTAVGTSFSVRNMPDHGIKVMVRSGVVDVGKGSESAIRLGRNQLASVYPNRASVVQSLLPWQIESELAWRNGMLSFNGTALGEAVRQFSRYSDIRIVVGDPDLAERRVVGLYSATDPVGFANAVALSMGLVVEKRADTVTLKHAALE